MYVFYRFCLGLRDWARTQSRQKIMQHMRMVKTNKVRVQIINIFDLCFIFKIQVSCGYALGLSTTGEPALKSLGGTNIETVKRHMVTLGGMSAVNSLEI